MHCEKEKEIIENMVLLQREDDNILILNQKELAKYAIHEDHNGYNHHGSMFEVCKKRKKADHIALQS